MALEQYAGPENETFFANFEGRLMSGGGEVEDQWFLPLGDTSSSAFLEPQDCSLDFSKSRPLDVSTIDSGGFLTFPEERKAEESLSAVEYKGSSSSQSQYGVLVAAPLETKPSLPCPRSRTTQGREGCIATATSHQEAAHVADEGKTALHLACESGRIHVARCLLELGADVNSADDQGRTGLHYAVRNGCLELVAVLLERGADKNATDHSGRTALHIAAEVDEADIVKLLALYGMDMDARVKIACPVTKGCHSTLS
ncbi:hypothetical protein LTS15_005897 [Exophiala xenobiotica]|nr:hypothetical protein LTS15_005897 [Exophiala xenobiotica]